MPIVPSSNTSQIREWHIYKITNPEERVYIGRTYRPKARILTHFSPTQYRNNFIKESTEKYGKELHNIEIIDTFEGSEQFANDKEMFWIRTYMSNIHRWPEMNGMNHTDGGLSLKGYNHTAETKKKMADWQIGILKPVNHLIKYHTGRKQNKEWVVKRAKTAEKPILMYDMKMNFIKEFPSIKDANIYFGKKTNGHISKVCKGKMHHIYKHIFKYKS